MISDSKYLYLVGRNIGLAKAVLGALQSLKKGILASSMVDTLISIAEARLESVQKLENPEMLSADKHILSKVVLEPGYEELIGVLKSILENWEPFLDSESFAALIRARDSSDRDKVDTVELVLDVLESPQAMAAISKATAWNEARVSTILRKLIR